MSDRYNVNGSGTASGSMKPEPGRILKTEGKVPLRFLVIAHHDDQMFLYCSARDKMLSLNYEEFMEVENPSVIKMTIQQMEERINHETARVAGSISSATL